MGRLLRAGAPPPYAPFAAPKRHAGAGFLGISRPGGRDSPLHPLVGEEWPDPAIASGGEQAAFPLRELAAVVQELQHGLRLDGRESFRLGNNFASFFLQDQPVQAVGPGPPAANLAS